MNINANTHPHSPLLYVYLSENFPWASFQEKDNTLIYTYLSARRCIFINKHEPRILIMFKTLWNHIYIITIHIYRRYTLCKLNCQKWLKYGFLFAYSYKIYAVWHIKNMCKMPTVRSDQSNALCWIFLMIFLSHDICFPHSVHSNISFSFSRKSQVSEKHQPPLYTLCFPICYIYKPHILWVS